MRNLLLLGLVCIVLLFGCVNQPPKPGTTVASTNNPTTTVQTANTVTPAPTAEPICNPSDLRFGDVKIPQNIPYGSKYSIEAAVILDSSSCKTNPASASIQLYDGLKLLDEVNLPSLNAKNTAILKFIPDQTRDYKLTLKVVGTPADGVASNNEYSFSLTANPIGYYSDIAGTTNFELSSANYYAQAFEISEPTSISSVYLLLKRTDAAYSSHEVYISIRDNAGGMPAGTEQVRSAAGFVILPKNFDWVKFATPRTKLFPGTYWLVVRTTTSETPIEMHAAPGVYGKPEYSLKSTSTVPGKENWQKSTDGVFNFKIENEKPPTPVA